MYTIPASEAEEEKEWLFSMKIVPSIKIENRLVWNTHTYFNVPIARFSVIVLPAAAMAIKLRRTIDIQQNYIPR